jgi:flavin-dependent dehydrogenase
VRRTRALIVGGGPAGAAAAIALARAGAAPELIERSAGPRDVVCGGFLGWDALGTLERLGVDVAALGTRPIGRVRLVSGSRVVEAKLPKAAAGLSRRTLDEALLAAASAAGAKVSRGRTVRAAEGTRRVRLDDGEEIEAEALFLATGKHELRGLARPLEGWREPLAAGLRTALSASAALEEALAGVIELHLFDDGYAGLLLQEDGSANFCLSVSRARLGASGGPDALLAEIVRDSPVLAERLAGAGAWDAIAGVPYGWRAGGGEAGLFRVGDQAAVIASIAGDGVAIALASGLAAAEAWRRGGPGGSGIYQRAFAARARRPVGLADALRRAAERPGPRAALLGIVRAMPMLLPLAARFTRIG